MVVEATFEFYDQFNFPQSPTSFTQKINPRHILAILYGIVDLSYTHRSSMVDLAYSFISEVSRSCLDRL